MKLNTRAQQFLIGLGAMLSVVCMSAAVATARDMPNSHSPYYTTSADLPGIIMAHLNRRDIDMLEGLHTFLISNDVRNNDGQPEIIFYYGVLKRKLQSWAQCCHTDVTAFLEHWREQYPASIAPLILKNRLYLSLHVQDEPFGITPPDRLLEAVSVDIAARPAAFRSNPGGYEALVLFTVLATWNEEQIYAVIVEALEAYPQASMVVFNSLRYADAASLSDTAIIAARFGGDEAFARVHQTASVWTQHYSMFKENRIDWPRIKRGLDRVIAKYPSEYNFTSYHEFSCQIGDEANAVKIAQKASEVLTGPEQRLACEAALKRYEHNVE